MPEEEQHKLQNSIDHLDKDLEKLDNSLDQLDTTLEKSFKAFGLWPTFFRGIIGALGAAIGGAIIITGLVYILQSLVDAPIIGDAISSVLDLIQQNK